MTNEPIAVILEIAKQNLSTAEMREASICLDDLADETAKADCERDGHQIDNDHCGRPEHRFCYHCHERETDIQARQGKANEPADRNSAVPSESLGSGSKSLFQRIVGVFGVLVIGLMLMGTASAQCTTQAGFVCISQESANKAATLAERLAAALEVIESFKIERASHNALITKLKEINDIDTLINTKSKYVIELYEGVIKLQGEIIDRLSKQLAKGKSAWDKFLGAVKTVASILIGVSIGRSGL